MSTGSNVTRMLGILVLASASVGWAQTPNLADYTKFGWDYPGHPMLQSFRIYIAPVDGAYETLPHLVVPAFPEMVTTVSTAQLILGNHGIYKAKAVAVGMLGETLTESEPSNEITFQYGAPAPDVPPVIIPPPIVIQLPPVPPPLTTPTPTPAPGETAPLSAEWMSQSCQYQGTCQK